MSKIVRQKSFSFSFEKIFTYKTETNFFVQSPCSFTRGTYRQNPLANKILISNSTFRWVILFCRIQNIDSGISLEPTYWLKTKWLLVSALYGFDSKLKHEATSSFINFCQLKYLLNDFNNILLPIPSTLLQATV